MKYFSKLLLLVSAMLLSQSCISEDKPSGNEAGVQVGQMLPNFEVSLNDGTIVSNTSLKGSVAVITFFNTSCIDCRNYLPVLNAVYEEIRADEPHPLRSVVFLPISRAQAAESVANYWAEQGFTLPYSAQSDRRVYELFASVSIPRNYIVNAQGKVTATYDDTNAPTAEELKAALLKALEK